VGSRGGGIDGWRWLSGQVSITRLSPPSAVLHVAQRSPHHRTVSTTNKRKHMATSSSTTHLPSRPSNPVSPVLFLEQNICRPGTATGTNPISPATRTQTLIVSVAPLRVSELARCLAGWLVDVALCWDVSVRARGEADGWFWDRVGDAANRGVDTGEGGQRDVRVFAVSGVLE
jgi:hypothetical protein